MMHLFGRNMKKNEGCGLWKIFVEKMKTPFYRYWKRRGLEIKY